MGWREMDSERENVVVVLWSQMARPSCSVWHDLTLLILEVSSQPFPCQDFLSESVRY